MSQFDLDLVVLVSDKNMEWAVRGILSRPSALGIRPIMAELYVHPERDPGCLRNGHTFPRSMSSRFEHAIVMFDHVGSGREEETADILEGGVTELMAKAGWADRATAIVLSPELEVWVWSDSSEVDRCLGWPHQQLDLRTWLR